MPSIPPRLSSSRPISPIAPCRPPGRGRVSDNFRREAIDYVLAHRHARSLEDLAAELGVHQRTLYRWIEEAPPRVPLAPVVVVEGEHERRTAPVVVLPGGARIEGLDLAALAELVRRLG